MVLVSRGHCDARSRFFEILAFSRELCLRRGRESVDATGKSMKKDGDYGQELSGCREDIGRVPRG
jgi:hypothetical protein